MIDQDAIRRPADIFDHWARLTPQATALQFEGRRTSYAALNHEGDQVANGLIALGLKPQARIGFLGRNSDRYFTLLAGAIKANMVIVGVNWRLAPPEVAYILKDAGCATLFVGAEYYGLVEGILGMSPTSSRSWPWMAVIRNGRPSMTGGRANRTRPSRRRPRRMTT